MSYTYAKRKQAGSAAPKTEAAGTQGPSAEALRSVAAKPAAEQLGRRVDLPDAMRSKMESAFGADLGAVKLYESQAVADTGAKAIARGSDIAFAPGLLDFSSFGGQALLGHELSHVVSQARGEVTGSGFLSDAALEARADREGAMAAAGQTVAMPTASLSPVSAADAAGPMQASKEKRKQRKIEQQRELQGEAYYRLATTHSRGSYANYRKKYEEALAKERELAGKGAEIAPNPRLTGVGLLDRAKADATDEDGSLNERTYFSRAESILDFMSDEQLNSEAESAFRERLVDEYSASRGRRIAALNTGDAFTPDPHSPNGGILGKMYTRMMGADNLTALLSSGGVSTMGSVADLADARGVTPLLARQQLGVYGADKAAANQGSTMKDFWKYSVLAPAVNRSSHVSQAGRNASLGKKALEGDSDDPAWQQAAAAFQLHLDRYFRK